MISKTVIALLGVAAAVQTRAVEQRVSSAADIARVTHGLQPGDTVIMVDGPWKDQTILFKGNGTIERPIVLRAERPGKVVLTGKSGVAVEGEHLVVSGLCLKNGELTGDGVKITGNQCRLTETAVIGGAYKFYVHVFGTSNRMDRCYLAGKRSVSPTLQIEAEGKPNYHRIDHNHFGPRPPLRRNGGETIRVGYSWQSMSNSCTVVEQNLFDRCDGENEIVSNKSCENVYRFNTFLNCAGMFTLRHGNRCVVEGNFFLGHRKRGSGGIRVIGEDHTIINNYIDGVTEGGFWITAGIPDSPLVGYFQARNCLIAFNTVVDSVGPCLRLDAGFGSSRRSLLPEHITIANNLFVVSKQETLLEGTEGNGFTWIGNIASGPAETGKRQKMEIRLVGPKLERAKDGLWRPAADSPVRASAEGHFPMVTVDVDGQERKAPFDVGCDQLSDGLTTNRPLTASEVGPSWMDRNDVSVTRNVSRQVSGRMSQGLLTNPPLTPPRRGTTLGSPLFDSPPGRGKGWVHGRDARPSAVKFGEKSGLR